MSPRNPLEWIGLSATSLPDALNELRRRWIPQQRLAAIRTHNQTVTAAYWPSRDDAAPPVIVVHVITKDPANGLYRFSRFRTRAELATVREMARMRRVHHYH